jgi:hypothetical protein
LGEGQLPYKNVHGFYTRRGHCQWEITRRTRVSVDIWLVMSQNRRECMDQLLVFARVHGSFQNPQKGIGSNERLYQKYSNMPVSKVTAAIPMTN